MHGVTDEKITPNMFASENPPDRIIGVECEYNLQTYDEANFIGISRYLSKDILKRIGMRSMSGYLANGARVYPDQGHLEYCTPECRGPYQAAAADIAGIDVVASIVEASEQEHRGLYRISGTSLKDTTILEKSQHTNGVHENFMAPLEVSASPLLDGLLPTYYATRVAAMAGTVSRNKYEFSQKANGIDDKPIERRITRQTTAGQKPMALIHSQDQEKFGAGWMLLETRFADAPMSLAARRHALASTSLMLRLCEHEDLLKRSNLDNFDDIILKFPVSSTKRFMRDQSLTTTAEVMSGKRMNMLDINEKLAEKAALLSSLIQLPADELAAIEQWQRINDAFRRSNPEKAEYDPFLLREFSVATKHYWLNRIGAFEKGDAEAKTRSLQWDRVLPAGNGRIFMEKTADDPQIEYLKKNAPLTRAAVRGKFVEEYADEGSQYYGVTSWAKGKQPYVDIHRAFVFSDAYGYKD